MADYFPLILRAVTALDPNTPQRREAIFARAREALDRQLLGLDPPIPDADLRRERGALEATIRRVEAQFAVPQPAFRPDPGLPSSMMERDVAGQSPPTTQDDETAGTVLADEPHRPKIGVDAERRFFAHRSRALLTAIGLPVMLLIAGAAYVMRDDPARYQAQPPGSAPESASNVAGGRKNDGRLDGTGLAGPATGPRPAPPVPERPVLPVASRVLYFEESPSDPRGVQSDGIVVWRLEPVPASAGRPADQAIRGSMTIAGAKMALDMVVKRNRESVLPASHTIEMIFRPEGDREGIREISPIEARDQETNPGVMLQGAIVPVATSLFLIGLDRSEAALARNLESLRDKRWFAFQFRSASGKLGAVLIEKGQTGDRIFREALELWK